MGLMRRDGCRWRVQRVLVAMILTLADVPWRLTIDEIHGSKIRVSTNLRPKKLGLGLGDVLLMVLTFFWVGIYIYILNWLTASIWHGPLPDFTEIVGVIWRGKKARQTIGTTWSFFAANQDVGGGKWRRGGNGGVNLSENSCSQSVWRVRNVVFCRGTLTHVMMVSNVSSFKLSLIWKPRVVKIIACESIE